MESAIAPPSYERSISDLLANNARATPDRIWLAQRSGADGWETLAYRDGWARVASIGQSLLDLGLKPGNKIAILSGNSIEHGLVMMAGLSVGMVVAPISPNYSLPTGLSRLAEVARVLAPDLVFVQRMEPFEGARSVPELARARWVTALPHHSAVPLVQLEAATPADGFRDAHAAIEPDMTAKILFTSGSTGVPKGVINTHRMLSSNGAMAGAVISTTEPDYFPIQVEWLPWHHTMGGNAIFNGIVRAGGTLYIDPGRPTPEAFHHTIACLRQVSPTSMINVPAGIALLVNELERDHELRQSVFKRLRRVSAGGAVMPPSVIDRFQQVAVETTGSKIPFVSAYGATETAPGLTMTYWASELPSELGLPLPGVVLKLVPYQDKYELRVKGPNVTPSYLNRPDLAATAFDAEGFYCLGDAVTFIDPHDASKGLRFAGRLSEDFKLTNGTWVSPGELRVAILAATVPLLQDVVVAGENRDSVAILAWPNPEAAKRHVSDPDVLTDPARLATDPGVLDHLSRAVRSFNDKQRSSSRVSAFRLLAKPPALDSGEITDKAYVNQRAVLANRSDLVEDLYRIPAPAGVVRL